MANGQITLKNVRVPEENRLQGGNSFRDTAKVLKMTRYAVAWMSTGCAMGAYEAAVKYSQERLQFGKPIGSFQLMQDLLARMLANITASQCLIVRQAQLFAEGKLSDAHAALSKAFCTSKCRETVAWAREISAVTVLWPTIRSLAFSTTAKRSTPTRAPSRCKTSSSAKP